MVSSSEDMILAAKETLRYGLFLGTFAGTFVSVDELISALGGHRRHVFFPLFFFFYSVMLDCAIEQTSEILCSRN